MTFKRSQYKGAPGKAFGEPLQSSLSTLAMTDSLRQAIENKKVLRVDLIGPFPIVSASAAAIKKGGSLSRVMRTVGWRALFAYKKEPLAIVDITAQPSRYSNGHVRGLEAASTFNAALKLATATARRQNWRDRHTLKVVKIPHVYVSALWLSGTPSLVIPLRLGSPVRPPTELWMPSRLLHAIEGLRRVHGRPEKPLTSND